MDLTLFGHLRAAYRDDLQARRGVIQRLRQLGHGCLASALAAVFGPDTDHLDAWALAQVNSVLPLTEEQLDDIMPWRSAAVACRAIAEALARHTRRPWHVRVLRGLGLVVGPPKERLLRGKELSEEDREALAERFGTSTRLVKFPGLSFPDTEAGLRECVIRAEGKEYVYWAEGSDD